MSLIIICILLVVVYFYFANKQQYWKHKNVKYIKPVPFFGNMLETVTKKKSFSNLIEDLYNYYPQERCVGIFQMMNQPTLMIRDPNLIKQITIKDFEVFPEHKTVVDENVDPLWGKNLFSSREQKWRLLRPTLSPAFTSSKMKSMFSLIKDCAEELVTYFSNKKEAMVTIDLKDVFTRYATDVIATAAFGVKCNSLKNPNNEFYLMGADASNFKGIRAMKFFLNNAISKWFNIQMFSKPVRTFFMNLISETISVREKKAIVRLDMLNLLMEARKGRTIKDEVNLVDTGFATVEEAELVTPKVEKQKQELTLEDITAQALMFFIGGFETASILMCYMTHELACHPDIQERLREEVDRVFKECNGNITYERVMGMKYLDMVVCETLRMWPPSGMTDRKCVRPYTIQPENKNEEPIHLPKDSLVWFPIYAIHRDAKYFPDPERFDPERFSDDNKHKVVPFTYLPFGMGPRNCLGSRFAIMETKVIICYILRNFEVEVVDKTPIPIRLIADFSMIPKGGFWVGLKARCKTK